MGLKANDLKDTIIKRISIDSFEPKTGDVEDIVVVAFYLKEESAAKDLFHYISSGITDTMDVEVSPNPDFDGFFLVFVELSRTDDLLNNIQTLVKDIENVSGKLNWQATTHLTDDYFPLFGDSELGNYLITDPAQYQSREQFEEKQKMMQQEQEQFQNSVLEFVKRSGLNSVSIEENVLKLSNWDDTAELQIVDFGEANDVMSKIGIAESKFSENDGNTRRFAKMIRPLDVVKINEYVVIFHPTETKILVTKPC